MPTTDILPVQITRGSQSWDAQHIVSVAQPESTFKVRARIRRDSYDHQSFALAEVFSPAECRWNIVINLPINETATGSLVRSGMTSLPMDAEQALWDDLELLIDLAVQVVS